MSVIITTTILQGNAASAVEIVAIHAGAALHASRGAGDGVDETRAGISTGLSAEVVPTVVRTLDS